MKDLKLSNGGLITDGYNSILTDVGQIIETAGLEQLWRAREQNGDIANRIDSRENQKQKPTLFTSISYYGKTPSNT